MPLVIGREQVRDWILDGDRTEAFLAGRPPDHQGHAVVDAAHGAVGFRGEDTEIPPVLPRAVKTGHIQGRQALPVKGHLLLLPVPLIEPGGRDRQPPGSHAVPEHPLFQGGLGPGVDDGGLVIGIRQAPALQCGRQTVVRPCRDHQGLVGGPDVLSAPVPFPAGKHPVQVPEQFFQLSPHFLINTESAAHVFFLLHCYGSIPASGQSYPAGDFPPHPRPVSFSHPLRRIIRSNAQYT